MTLTYCNVTEQDNMADFLFLPIMKYLDGRLVPASSFLYYVLPFSCFKRMRHKYVNTTKTLLNLNLWVPDIKTEKQCGRLWALWEVLWNRNDFLRFRFRILVWQSFGSGSASGFGSGSGSSIGSRLIKNSFSTIKNLFKILPFQC